MFLEWLLKSESSRLEGRITGDLWESMTGILFLLPLTFLALQLVNDLVSPTIILPSAGGLLVGIQCGLE